MYFFIFLFAHTLNIKVSERAAKHLIKGPRQEALMTPTLDMKFGRPREREGGRQKKTETDVKTKQERRIKANKRVSLHAARGIWHNLKNRCHVNDRLTLRVRVRASVCVCVLVCVQQVEMLKR